MMLLQNGRKTSIFKMLYPCMLWNKYFTRNLWKFFIKFYISAHLFLKCNLPPSSTSFFICFWISDISSCAMLTDLASSIDCGALGELERLFRFFLGLLFCLLFLLGVYDTVFQNVPCPSGPISLSTCWSLCLDSGNVNWGFSSPICSSKSALLVFASSEEKNQTEELIVKVHQYYWARPVMINSNISDANFKIDSVYFVYFTMAKCILVYFTVFWKNIDTLFQI